MKWFSRVTGLKVCRTCIFSPSSCINFFPSFVHGAGVCWVNQGTLNDAGEIFDRLIFRAFRCSVHTEPTSPYERNIYLGSVGEGGVKLNSMTFQSWETKFLNFMTFQVFNDFYEPCFCNKISTCCSFDRRKVNLFCNTWRNSRVLRDSHIILSNQKSVFTQLQNFHPTGAQYLVISA